MCGIAGVFGTQPIAASTLAASLAALSKRGPDATGQVGWDNQWQLSERDITRVLLHTRLSIMDTRAIANQPMQAEGRPIWLCYNGEVYDWQDQAKKLQAAGATFNSHSDTEFILQAYLHWGFEKTLSELRGMFAFTIVDLEQNKVFCARDRFGLKPFIYYHDDQQFAFASLVSAIQPLLPKPPTVSQGAIDAYLNHRYIPAPMTIFDGVQRLENGHCLTYDLTSGDLKKRAYWQPQASDNDFLDQLAEAVRIRTQADRPVGLFLSGGIDSATIAAQLAEQGYHNIHAFTAEFPGSTMDESQQAKQIAEQLGLPHSPVTIPTSIRDDFDQIVADCDEPFADPSAFPLWYLSKAAATEVKVVLNGDGGDELFAGYKRYQKHQRSHFRRRFRLPFAPILSTLNSKGLPKLLTELRLTWEQAYSLRFSGFTINQRKALGIKHPKPSYWRSNGQHKQDPIDALLDIDHQNYLPEYILRKADLVTMAHGLEGRSPLLDHKLYDSAMALPKDQRFTQPAKQILAPICETLGDANPLKQKKRGFNPPLTHWLREDLKPRFDGLGTRLNDLTAGLLNAAAIDQLCQNYLDGEERLAEQVLQLFILDSSLTQLNKALAD